MKKLYRKLIALMLAFGLSVALLPLSAAAKVTAVNEDGYALLGQTFTPLDISKQANRAFADDVGSDGKGGWGDGGPDNDLRDFKLRGEQYLRGVLFNIIEPSENDNRSCIVLRGMNDANLPTSVEIDVNQTAAGVYFLHAASWLDARVGQYVFVYEDGTEEAIEIVGGKDVLDWWGAAETETVRTAWRGTANMAGMVSLGLFALENPHPEKKIAKLRLQSYGDKAYPMIVAITLTDKGPYLPITVVENRYNPDTSEWFPYEYPRNFEKVDGTALDISHMLDAPAGKHGFARAEGENIVFEDGTREVFWGGNLGGPYLYQTYENAEYIAKVFAQKGINLLRMHMHDSEWAVSKISGWTDAQTTTREIDEIALDKLHYLVYQMKQHGVYMFFDICAGRQVMEDDGIKDWEYLSPGLKPAVFYDEQLQRLQMEAVEEIMGRINPYTGVSLLEEPAILVVAMNNESNVFNDKLESPYYRAMLTEKYNKWLMEKYGNRENLRQAWVKDGVDALKPEENPEDGSVRIYGDGERWSISGRRRIDNLEFLSYIMDQYSKKMVEHYRRVGGKQMIAIDTVWGNDISAFEKGITRGDVMDYHHYFLHPLSGVYDLKEGLRLPQPPDSWIGEAKNGLLSHFAAMRIKGKPYTISEWNSVEPNPYISDSPLLVASYSGMHGWCPMQYTLEGTSLQVEFRDDPEPLEQMIVWTGSESPHVFDMIPAAAIAQRSVTEMTDGYFVPLDPERFYEPANQSNVFPNHAYLIGRAGIADKSIDNVQTGAENLILAAEKDARENKKPFVSLTNETSMDMENRIFKLNTPRSQAAAGYIQDREIELEDVIIKTDLEYATIVFSSLTEEPIYRSDKLLLTTSARARKTDLILSDDGTKVLDGGRAPTLVEPVTGEFTLKTDADVEIWALSPQGERKARIPTMKDGSGVHFSLCGNEQAINYEIVKTGGTKKRNPEIDLGVYRDKPLFRDVEEKDREEVERAYLTDAMRATGDQMFSPQEAVTRGDFVNAVVEAMSLSGDTSFEFTDVSKSRYDYIAIHAARALKIVNGKDENTFGPDEPITPEEANIILKRAEREPFAFDGDKVTRLETAKIAYKLMTD